MRNYAMLGKWHVHAPQYAKEIGEQENCRVAKVWDPDAALAAEWAKELGCESATVEDILADPSIEGVVICNATNEHTPLMLRAIRAGKAVFTEKVLALTTKEADELASAIREHGTRFAISFVHMSQAHIRFALETAKSGKLGTINYARVRKAHDGATGNWLPPHFYDPIACGGGAMIDLGAHPMYLLCAMLGEPTSVQSAFTHVTGKAVEDNAVSLLTFEGGAIGVSETGFVSARYPFTIELGGTKGSLLLRDKQITYCCPETNNEWRAPERLPDALPSPIVQWALATSQADIADELGIEPAVQLTRVMEMAYRK